MDLLSTLGLGQTQTAQIGQQLGVTPEQMTAALEAAAPLLLGKIGHNAQDPQAAALLSQAVGQHDGSALDTVSQGQLPDLHDGQAILGHVFGGQQSAAVNAVSQRAGISPQLALQILSMVAPLVMGYLSRNRSGGAGGNLGGLGSILGSVLGGGGLGSILGSVLGGGMSGGQRPSSPSAPQQSSGGMGDLGGMLGSILGGAQAPSAVPGGVGLEPLDQGQSQGQSGAQAEAAAPHSGNALEDLIHIFGGQRR